MMSSSSLKDIRFLCLLVAASLAFSSCMKQVPGAVKAANPILEVEMDLFFMDLVAAQVKINEIMLERIPISLEDDWPELLKHYSDGEVGEGKEKEAKRLYEECLERALKEDFSFYRFYDFSVYLGAIFRSGSMDDLMGCALVAARGKLAVEASKVLGRRFEHAKWALSSYPFGCKCPYYGRKFRSLRPGSEECRAQWTSICPFFSKPIEETLNEKLFGGGIRSWIDFEVPIECLRVVSGEHLGTTRKGSGGGTFENVFYSLLPVNLRDNLQRLDDELFLTINDLKAVQAKMEVKGIHSAEVAALKRQKESLEKEKSSKEKLQDKLYKEALSTIQVDPAKIAIARKLLNITHYIDATFGEVMTAMVALTVKIVDDVLLFGEMSANDLAQRVAFLTAHGIVKGVDMRKRLELLGKRAISLPVTWASTWGYAIAQKAKVSRYRDYLEAVVKMEDKVKKGSKI